MATTGHQSSGTVTAAPSCLALDLAAEIARLHQAPIWRGGEWRTTVVNYPDFQINLIAIQGGHRIEEHHNPGRVSVHTVDGHIRMHAANQTFDLPKGHVLVLDRAVRHDVEAVEDSAFLLTVARPQTPAAH